MRFFSKTRQAAKSEVKATRYIPHRANYVANNHALQFLLFMIAANLIKAVSAAGQCFYQKDHASYEVSSFLTNDDKRAATDSINNCGMTAYDCNIDSISGLILREILDSLMGTIQYFSFGKGTFGGTICDVRMTSPTQIPMDDCVQTAIKSHCTDGFGTVQDLLAVVGISVGGLLILGCAAGLINYNAKKVRASNAYEKLEGFKEGGEGYVPPVPVATKPISFKARDPLQEPLLPKQFSRV